MAGLMSKIQQFARSPQGKKAMSDAQRYAKDPKRRRQLDDLRRRFTGGGKKGPR
jgi:hypothetical protein